jgi:tRNA threonylcarbamoyladenosine biosynthesis protein TsaE
MDREHSIATDSFMMDSPSDVPDAAARIIEAMRGRRIVALYGPMGAGKTTLIKEIAEQLGVEDTVSSPTFSIVNQYMLPDGGFIYHFDFYRIDKPEEVYDIGYEEYFASGDLCLLEWPEKIESLLPPDTLRITITPSAEDDSRSVVIEARRGVVSRP